MSSSETLTAARAPCPCGQGQITVVVTYTDSDWGARDHTQSWRITCAPYASAYTLVRAGRGYDVVTAASKARAAALAEEACRLERAFLDSTEVAAVLDQATEALEALPSMVARYRVLKELGVAFESLTSYRKYARRQTVARWLEPRRQLNYMPALFRFVGADPARPTDILAQVNASHEAAYDALECVGQVGPVSMAAALAGGGR